MTADPILFRDLAYVFLAAVLGGALAWVTRQPLILGYVLGGLFISPLTPGPGVSDVRSFEIFADIGVVLLMFCIGIEFSLRDFLRVKWVAFLGGPLGILLSAGLGLGTWTLLGWSPREGIAVGLIISVSSTMVLARLLMDRGELHSRHGRIMIGIALVEDLAVVALIVLMPTLGTLEPSRLLAIGIALGKSGLILLPFIYLAAKVVSPLMTRVARTQNQELFLLVALATGLGTAALTQAVGLSLALGAFLAGLIISESDYAHETLARLLSLRDAFGALFFVTVGALIDPRVILDNLRLLGVMVGLVLVGKFAVRAGLTRLAGEPLETAVLVGVGLAQIGEFSFILVQVARSAGQVGSEVYNATLAASLLTILVNALLTRLVSRPIVRARLARQEGPVAPEREALHGHVVICGFGRVGSAVGEALETFGLRYLVVEIDPDVVKQLRRRGVHCLFGDAAHRRVLEAAGTLEAALVVIALPEIGRVRLAVRNVRVLNPRVPILARAHSPAEIADLVRAGATEVIQPEMEAAATLIRHSLVQLSQPREQVLAYLERFRSAVEMAPGAAAAAGDALPRVREVTLDSGGIADRSLREARVRERFGVTVVGITRANGDSIINPAPDTIMRPGDRLRVFGLPEQIAALVAAGKNDR